MRFRFTSPRWDTMIAAHIRRWDIAFFFLNSQFKPHKRKKKKNLHSFLFGAAILHPVKRSADLRKKKNTKNNHQKAPQGRWDMRFSFLHVILPSSWHNLKNPPLECPNRPYWLRNIKASDDFVLLCTSLWAMCTRLLWTWQQKHPWTVWNIEQRPDLPVNAVNQSIRVDVGSYVCRPVGRSRRRCLLWRWPWSPLWWQRWWPGPPPWQSHGLQEDTSLNSGLLVTSGYRC